MIILDTCVLRGEGNGSSTEVLRAIRTAGVEGVAVPWMVMEELVAQHAVKYRKQYEATAQAFQSLGNVTPWDLDVRLPEIDMERVREHWRKHWSRVVDVVPTSESALREAAFREANRLPPCKDTDKKAGARDAAIWLSAVEYAKAHPDETVYFVSGNTTDFGDGKSYPDAMGTDVAELGARFVHLTGLGEVIDRFTVPTVTEQDVIKSALKSKPVLNAIIRLAHGIANISGTDSDLWLNTLSRQGFSCTAAGPNYEPVHARGVAWAARGLFARASAISNMESYRVGEHVWCMATVRWLICGFALLDRGMGMAGCGLETRVLFAPHDDDPRLTVLRHSNPEPLSDAEFTAYGTEIGWTQADMSSGPQDGIPAWQRTVATGVKVFAAAVAALNARTLNQANEALGDVAPD
ncbi:PIN domain-containing protein [Streptomyces scabiei]|uniref:PIN domain-containing protein n=1 Tax=Streptomyces scabiei TaxID=1930 RepID=UPI002FF1D7A1